MDDVLVRKLASARVKRQSIKDAMHMMLKPITSSEEYTALEIDLKNAVAEEAEYTFTVKDEAMSEYGVTGNKHPNQYVEVKEFTEVEILDPIGATEWCIGHFTPALVLDEKTFMAAAEKKQVPAEFVSVRKEPRALISRDLSELLESKDAVI